MLLMLLVFLPLCAARELSFLKRSARTPAPAPLVNDRARLERPPQCQKDLYPPDPRYSSSPLRAIEYRERDLLSVLLRVR